MTYKERVAKARERWAKRGGAPPMPTPDLPDPCAGEQAVINRLERERNALLSALRDAVTIMHTARKSNWHEHDRALSRFDLDHPKALGLLEDNS